MSEKSLPVVTRRCRECSACCTTHAVPELDKGEQRRCTHQRNGFKGCAIYKQAERPQRCADFACLWLQGIGKEQDRPDRLGVVIDHVEHPRYGRTFQLYEVRRGAKDDARVRTVAQGLAKIGLVIYMGGEGRLRTVLGGPDAAIEAFRRDLAITMAERRSAAMIRDRYGSAQRGEDAETASPKSR